MTSAPLVIFRRHLARLRSNRSVAIAFVFGAGFLTLMVTINYGIHREMAKTGDFAVEFQHGMWGPRSDLYGALVAVFAVVLGSSLVNDDLRSGTIFGVLARPVSRTDYFVGSWLGAATFVVVLQSMHIAVALGPAIVLGGSLTAAYLLAIVATVAGALLTLTLFAALGAVASTAVSVLLGFSILLISGLAFSASLPAWLVYPLRGIAIFLPLAGEQNDLVAKGLLGESRAAAPLVEIIAYRACWVLALFALGAWGFSRREIAPRT